jgi:hypothetical protein
LTRFTEWLSGSGGTGETHIIFAPLLANRRCFERQSRCPTGAGVGPLLLLDCQKNTHKKVFVDTIHIPKSTTFQPLQLVF